MDCSAIYDFYLIGKGLDVEECESRLGITPHVCLLEGDEVRHKSTRKLLRFRDETVWGITSAGNVDSHIPEEHEKWLVQVVSDNIHFINILPNVIEPYFEITVFCRSSVIINNNLMSLCNKIGANIGIVSKNSPTS